MTIENELNINCLWDLDWKETAVLFWRHLRIYNKLVLKGLSIHFREIFAFRVVFHVLEIISHTGLHAFIQYYVINLKANSLSLSVFYWWLNFAGELCGDGVKKHSLSSKYMYLEVLVNVNIASGKIRSFYINILTNLDRRPRWR